MAEDAELARIARELIALPPGEFTAARTARAKELRQGGSREVAATVARLRKPSSGAWAVDLLARERPARLRELTELGVLLRRAQEELDPSALRELSARRRALVAELAREARDLAEERGERLGDAAVEDVEETLQAALTDPAAADAVASGLLVRGLTGTGVEAVDLDGALAVSSAGAPEEQARAEAPERGRKWQRTGEGQAAPGESADRERAERERADRERADRERAAAEAAIRSAEDVLREAQQSLADAEERRRAARERHRELRAEVRRLTAALAEAQDALADEEDAVGEATADRDRATAEVDRAREQLDAARRDAQSQETL